MFCTLLGGSFGRFVQKKLGTLNLWEDPYYLVKENLKAGISVCEQWVTACSHLTGQVWQRYVPHPWKNEKYFPETLDKLGKRLEEVSSFWSLFLSLKQVLTCLRMHFIIIKNYASDGNSLNFWERRRAHIHVRWFVWLCGTISGAQWALSAGVHILPFSLMCGCSVFKSWTSILLSFVIKKITHLSMYGSSQTFSWPLKLFCKQIQYFREYSVVIFEIAA